MFNLSTQSLTIFTVYACVMQCRASAVNFGRQLSISNSLAYFKHISRTAPRRRGAGTECKVECLFRMADNPEQEADVSAYNALRLLAW